jgi:hypothetical protein
MAETTFKAIPFEKLNPETQSVIEANAKFQGMTPEQYYESRGGVNRSGYYGDTYQAAEKSNRPYMTEEEYAAVIADLNAKGVKGTSRGAAINIATAKKAFDAAKARGLSDDAATIESGYNPYTGETATITEVVNPKTGNPEIVFTRGDEYVFADGSTVKINSATVAGNSYYNLGSGSSSASLAAQQAAQAAAEEKRRQGQSAYNLLFEQFNQYGLGALVAPLQGFIVEGLSPAEFTLRLRDTDAYKKRFAANQSRIQRGLRALSEAEYIGLEDQYQNVMRNYGLPTSYYTRGDMGRQEGFEKFIGGDVSAAELEDRIITAQSRVLNAAPQVAQSLRQFYPEITGGDILAYALDPDKALNEIKRKVGAAEIGAGAAIAGLATGLSRAEELQRYGVTGEQARAGYQTIGEFLPRASQLGDIYAKQGLGPFTQTTAEEEVFGTTGAVEAGKKRRKLAQLEQAQFGGTSGAAQGALARERAGQY